MKYLLLLVVFMVGCAYEPYREFNTEDEQDGMCYAKYGGMQGYCTMPVPKGGPI